MYTYVWVVVLWCPFYNNVFYSKVVELILHGLKNVMFRKKMRA